MPAIIYNAMRILNADTFAKTIIDQPTFLFIGKETSWPDEEVAPFPVESEQEKTIVYRDMLAVKRIPNGAIASVIPRIDWVSGTVYDYFDHRINMIDDRKANGERYNFYVMTDEFNVYKCIGNGDGVPSTVKPTSTQISDFQTSDGYIWKYMYTILATDVFTFLTKDWMPVYTVPTNDGSSQWFVQASAVAGGIHNIIVDFAGSGYDSSNPPIVSIDGDGEGATAVCEVNPLNGSIRRITVTNIGSGYTEATVSLLNAQGGFGASFTPIISPSGGHGKDARQELGATHKMITVTLDGEEGGTFPATSFRQTGILYNVMSTDIGTKVTVTDNSNFKIGDNVTGLTSGSIGVVRMVDANGKDLWLEDVVGTFIQLEPIGNGDIAAQAQWVINGTNLPLTTNVANSSTIVPDSGQVLYLSNRAAIQRLDSQSEEIRLVISF